MVMRETENRLVTESRIVPGRVAAYTPRGIPTADAIPRAVKASRTVWGRLVATIWLTGWFETKSVPRSPRRAPHRNVPTCVQIGSSRPISSRTWAANCGLDRGPMISVAGSPGTIRASDARKTDRPSPPAAAMPRRLSKYRIIAAARSGRAGPCPVLGVALGDQGRLQGGRVSVVVGPVHHPGRDRGIVHQLLHLDVHL